MEYYVALAAPLLALAETTGVPLAPNPLGASAPLVSIPEQLQIIRGQSPPATPEGQQWPMSNNVLYFAKEMLRQRTSVLEQAVEALKLEATNAKTVNDAQEKVLREIAESQTTQSARLDELTARLDLVKAATDNLSLDLAANQAADRLILAELDAIQSRLDAEQAAVELLQHQQASTAAELAANTAADQLNAAHDAVTLATANAAKALADKANADNVAQQSQIDANAAQDALDRAKQTADEKLIAQAQATADAALQKANDDELLAKQALAAAAAAQATANNATTAAANAQTAANGAKTAADAAQVSANLAKTAADTAQAKADADAIAAANAQTTADQAKAAAASNATALAAVQTALAGKLDTALVRRGNQATQAITIQLTPASTVPVAFATPFPDNNYELFLSKPTGGLLGVELGWQNKTATGFTLTLRNTGLASLAVPASSVDYFAIRNT